MLYITQHSPRVSLHSLQCSPAPTPLLPPVFLAPFYCPSFFFLSFLPHPPFFSSISGFFPPSFVSWIFFSFPFLFSLPFFPYFSSSLLSQCCILSSSSFLPSSFSSCPFFPWPSCCPARCRRLYNIFLFCLLPSSCCCPFLPHPSFTPCFLCVFSFPSSLLLH